MAMCMCMCMMQVHVHMGSVLVYVSPYTCHHMAHTDGGRYMLKTAFQNRQVSCGMGHSNHHIMRHHMNHGASACAAHHYTLGPALRIQRFSLRPHS